MSPKATESIIFMVLLRLTMPESSKANTYTPFPAIQLPFRVS